ncbi:MAG: hypothetical protein P8107_08630 [Spirochaetia bacterium]
MIQSLSDSISFRSPAVARATLPQYHVSNREAQEALRRVMALVYHSGSVSPNPRALNLVLMAQTALKNGNATAAQNFADRAERILQPGLPSVPLTKPNPEAPPVPPTAEKIKKRVPPPEQKPAETRHMYHDVSHDAGVSFSYASSLSGPESFFAVPAHEAEHVGRRVSEAILRGERIMVSVSYRIKYDPRTGEPYMAGGVTRAIRLSHRSQYKPPPGSKVDLYA